MRIRCLSVGVVLLAFLSSGIGGAAQSEPAALGTFSGPFTTLSAQGELVYPGELDWYTFEIAGSDMTLYVLVDAADGLGGLRVLVFDSADVFVGSTETGSLSLSLAPGAYRVRVDSVDSRTAAYTLTISNGIESEPNDGILEAGDMGELNRPTRVSGSLLPVADADFFLFRVPPGGVPGGTLLIETSGATAGDTLLVLYRQDDALGRYVPVAVDDDSGDEVWSRLLFRPEPGARYAVRVEETGYPFEGVDEYVLAVTPLALEPDAEPNDTQQQAVILESASGASWSAAGFLHAQDPVDYFQLTIAEPALLQIETEPQPGVGDFDTLMVLYDAQGQVLAQNDDGGNEQWSRIIAPVDAGVVFVTVAAYDTDSPLTPYRLRAAANPVKRLSETEPNDTDEAAEAIDWASGEVLLIEAAIGAQGDIDSFRFVLSEPTLVIVETGSALGASGSFDTTLSLYDADLWEVAFNDDAIDSWSAIEQTLEPGTYYIVVESYYSDRTFDYILTVRGEAP